MVWQQMIIGVDEAGRGPLAGPVVAAAVVLCDGGIVGLDDSKKLSGARRAALEAEIKAQCRWAVGEAGVAEIDAINILQATLLAMTRAVDALVAQLSLRHAELVSASMAHSSDLNTAYAGNTRTWTPDQVRGDESSVDYESSLLVLVDGNRLPRWRYPSTAVVRGDSIHACISAASIIAKEHRDRIMVAADSEYPGYGWASNKGYGAAAHIKALHDLGSTPLHRRSFAPVSACFERR
jgi:ribonuclease HII